MSESQSRVRTTLADLAEMKTRGEKIAMLTAYDHPTAALAEAAGVHALLVGDSMGMVLLGHETTRDVPIDLMITLAEAVRRGAPNTFLIGDVPFQALSHGIEFTLSTARRFCDEAGCDAVKIETGAADMPLISATVDAGYCTIAHLGLRPQQVLTAAGYRAQAREPAAIETLVTEARAAIDAGAHMLLLEAVPNEAAQAVVAATTVPVIGCGAGPACDGHILVTEDMLGWGADKPPRFVPLNANLREAALLGMRCWVQDIVEKRYPGPEHTYSMRKS